MGIEPTLVAWEATVLPLNYTRARGPFYCAMGPLCSGQAVTQNPFPAASRRRSCGPCEGRMTVKRGTVPATAADVSLEQARRLALRAQGFGARRRTPPRKPALLNTVRTLGAVQIDSVNVLVRSHYLPAYSRHGAYDPELLDDLAYGPDRQLFEYWGHEASLLPLALQPLLRWRMERARRGEGLWSGVAKFGRERAQVLRGGARARADARPPRRVGTRCRWPPPASRLVGLESWQGRARVAVLVRRDHDAQSTAVRADLRRDRARAAGAHREQPGSRLRRRTARTARGCRCAHWVWRRSAICATTSACRRPMPVCASPSSSKPAISCLCGSRAGRRRRSSLARRTTAPLGVSPGPALAVRFAGLGASAHRAPVRFPLSARDLHARRTARAWLLRAAVPARRSRRRPRRFESRSAALGPERDQPAPRAARNGRASERTAA